MAVKGASLLPEDAVGGGSIPDGEYTIKEVTTDVFTYNGQVPEGVPAIMVLYKSDDGTEYEQPYKAGDNDHLVPSEDKTRFEHPNGRDQANIYKGGAAHLWLSSLKKAGFPFDKVGDNVTVFKGIKVLLTNVAAPTGKTSDEKKAGKTVPVVSKILAMGKGAAPAKAAARPTAAPAKAPASAPASTDNGEPSDLDLMTITEIQKLLATTPSITRLKFGTLVVNAVARYKNSTDESEVAAFKQLAAINKTARDTNWLTQYAELGGWVFDNDTITSAS